MWSQGVVDFDMTDVRLGWESYGGAAMTLWFDDVELSDTPIGCP